MQAFILEDLDNLLDHFGSLKARRTIRYDAKTEVDVAAGDARAARRTMIVGRFGTTGLSLSQVGYYGGVGLGDSFIARTRPNWQ